MAMEHSLVALLVADGPVSALAGDRISWFGRQRGDALPAITLTKVSPGREWNLDGPDWLDRPRVQIDLWCDDPLESADLRDAVLACMEAGGFAVDTTFHPAALELERWDEEENPDGGARLFRVQLDFQFFHEEA